MVGATAPGLESIIHSAGPKPGHSALKHLGPSAPCHLVDYLFELQRERRKGTVGEGKKGVKFEQS